MSSVEIVRLVRPAARAAAGKCPARKLAVQTRATRGRSGLALLALMAGCCVASSLASNDADQDWRAILEFDSGPRQSPHSQAEAVTIARQQLEREKAALETFNREHPADPRHYEADIRLSDVLAARSRLGGDPADRETAQKLLDGVEFATAAPPSVRADAGYARVSHLMQESAGAGAGARDSLVHAIRQFDSGHSSDRRIPGLLAELATLYDDQPAAKKALLDEALARSSPADERLRTRVADDLKRLALLGHPLNLRLQPMGGGPAVDLAMKRGRVVVLLFWASWSAPSLSELAQLQAASVRPEFRSVEFLTVSLDEDRAALAAAVRELHIPWLVHCDGRGWQGEMVRSLGINALPTTWVIDPAGKLVTLNARDHLEEIVRAASGAQ